MSLFFCGGKILVAHYLNKRKVNFNMLPKYEYASGGRYPARVKLHECPELDFVVFQMGDELYICTRSLNLSFGEFEKDDLEFTASNKPLFPLPASFLFKWKPSAKRDQILMGCLSKKADAIGI